MKSGYLTELSKFNDLLADYSFAAAFQWLQDRWKFLPTMPPQSYPIAEGVRAIVIEYIPEHPDQGRLETHNDHVDLHVVIGPDPERMMWGDTSELEADQDLPDQDVTYYKKPRVGLNTDLLNPGQFMIFDVGTDAHLPQRITNYTAPPSEHLLRLNRKVVIKLREETLTPGLDLGP